MSALEQAPALPAEPQASPADDGAIDVRPIPSWMVADVWPDVIDMLQRAIDRGPGDRLASDYWTALRAADCQLWLILRGRRLVGAFVTEVMAGPRRKLCWIELMAGDGMEAWLPEAEASVATWAREIGCHAVQAWTRKGLVKATRPLGYREIATVIRRRLDT